MTSEQHKLSLGGSGTSSHTRNTSSSRLSRTNSSLSSNGNDLEKGHHSHPDSDHDNQRAIPVTDTTDTAVEENEKDTISRVVSVTTGNVVDWNNASDPRRPINWTAKKKWMNISVISVLTFLTPLASSMVAPAVPSMMRDFRSTDTTIASFIVSIYILGYAVGPLFIAPLSEICGRLYIYHVCNISFIVWNMACALAPTSSIASLLIFRLLAGIAGSCPITIFAGSIADVFIQEKRGGAMAIAALGPLVGPVIGPVAGGFLSEAAGWRWVYWVITIAAGVTAVGSIILQRETYEPILLQKLTDKLKKETSNPHLRSKLDNGLSKKEMFKRAIIRPTKMLVRSPIVLSLSVYIAVIYGYLYLLFTTLTPVFEGTYGFGPGPVGLVFLGIGVGSFAGLVTFGIMSDRLLKSLTKRSGTDEMKPEYRLPPLLPASLIIPIGLFWYGWSVENASKVHWIVPIIGTALVGIGMIGSMMASQTYLVDAFTIHAASAIAANTVLRSLVGAFLPLAGPKLYDSLGLGWGNSLLAFIALALSPMAWIFYRYGEMIRKRYAVEF